MSRNRRSALRFGLAAETRAGWLLRLKGYSILDRRVRMHGGEIDLVARRGRTLVFVEVKARASLDEAAEAIRAPQMRRIGAAARAWLGRHPADRDMTVRFDAVHVAPARWPRHIVNAFEIDIW